MADHATIQAAVKALLKVGKWPVNRDYDDAGLSEHGYVEFVEDVLAIIHVLEQSEREK